MFSIFYILFYQSISYFFDFIIVSCYNMQHSKQNTKGNSAMKMNLRIKLILIFITCFTIPMVVSQVIFARYADRFTKESSAMLNIQNMDYIGISSDQIFSFTYDFGLYITFETNITNFLTCPKNHIEYSTKKANAQNALAILPFSNEYIKGIALWGHDGQFAGSGDRTITLSDEEKNILNQANGAPVWNFVTGLSGHGDIYFSRMLRIPSNLQTEIGFLKILLNTKVLDQLFSDNTPNPTDYYIMDGNGKIVYSYGNSVQKPEILDAVTPGLLEENLKDTVYMKEWDSYVTPYKLSNTPWYLFSISANTLAASVNRTLNTMRLSFTIGCSIICLLLSLFFTSIIISPLKKLGQLMEHIENEDFSVRFHVNSRDEIGHLADQFNKMSERLQSLYNEVYLKNIKLKDAQLSILQSQINPHFLYNTLDTIYWMSEFNRTQDVSRMISSLSRLFRLSLSGDENDMVSLESELEHVNCYLYIQKIRYQEQLECSVITDIRPADYMVIKLVLQPLAENAILHGIDTQGEGKVTIHIFEENECLIYEVTDTGGAADPEKINQILGNPISSEGGIGLKNIHDRIRLRHAGNYGINCRVENGRTIFRVTLPIIRI